MTVFAIAQITITNRKNYDSYQNKFFEVFRKFQGTLLASDESPSVIEGKWERHKVVLMSFPDEQLFLDWSTSEEYQQISVDRKLGSEALVLLVKSS